MVKMWRSCGWGLVGFDVLVVCAAPLLCVCLSVHPLICLSDIYSNVTQNDYEIEWSILLFFFFGGGRGEDDTSIHQYIYKLTTLDGDLTTFCIWDRHSKKKKQRTNNQQKNIQKTQERESTKLFGNLIFLLITNNYHYYYLLHQFIYLSSVRIVEERHITHTHHTYNHPSFFFNTIAVSSLFFFFWVIQISPKFAEVFVR